MKASVTKIILLVITLLVTANLHAQDSTATQKKAKYFGFPFAYFSPETSWAFGGAGIMTFRFKNEPLTSRPSQLQLGAAYTLEDQLLLYFPFELFWNNNDYRLYGEVGYYKFSYFFHGIGNRQPDDFEELFKVDFPRVRLNILKKVKPHLYIGGRYWMDHFDIKEISQDGQLIDQTITGSQGGFLSGLGIISQYEKRDNIFFPTKGSFGELVLFYNSKLLGSDFNFAKIYGDYRAYFPFGKKRVLALSLCSEYTFGDAPFNQLSLLGGNKKMRGYYEGRYRDKLYVCVQTEYRFPLFWRLGGVVFGGVGKVENKFEDIFFDYLKYNYGVGLRILVNKKDHVNLRIDAAFGQNSSGFYLTIGEAF